MHISEGHNFKVEVHVNVLLSGKYLCRAIGVLRGVSNKQARFHESQGDVMYLLPFICTHTPTHVIILCAIYSS